MTRVALVIPPSGFLLDERVFPSLGVLKVAAALEQRHIPVSVVDLSGESNVRLAMQRAINRTRWSGEQPTHWGITATMPQMPAAKVIAETLRYFAPDARRILGGPHPTLLRASVRQEVAKGVESRASVMFRDLYRLFDTVVCGDGERAIVQALGPEAPPLIDGDDPHSALWLTKADLTAAPFPARHLIDLASYKAPVGGVQMASMIAQLGCPFGCAFCGGRRSPFLRRVRPRSTEAVIAEMTHLFRAYGTKGFMFFDDELNVNPQFIDLLKAIIALQQSLGVSFRLRGLLKSELVTEEMAGLMFEAGFRDVLVGFESGAPRMLENIQKRATVDDNTSCVRILRKAGLKVKALMSLGHPGESRETIAETRAWLLDVRPDDFDATIITVYPGTPYFDDATPEGAYWTYRAANGDALHQVPVDHLTDVNFYKGVPHAYQSFVWTDALSREDLVEARDELEDDVRTALGIPYPTSHREQQFEHAMGL